MQAVPYLLRPGVWNMYITRCPNASCVQQRCPHVSGRQWLGLAAHWRRFCLEDERNAAAVQHGYRVHHRISAQVLLHASVHLPWRSLAARLLAACSLHIKQTLTYTPGHSLSQWT